MRRYLPGKLRKRFDIAWNILPSDVQQNLDGFIKYVKSADTLLGVELPFADDLIAKCEIDALGWCVLDPIQGKSHIWLKNDLQSLDEEIAVYVSLHEIAHAYEYIQDDWRAGIRIEERSEIAACSQVAAWAARDASKIQSGGYEKSFDVAFIALNQAHDELMKWHRTEFDAKLSALVDSLSSGK